MIKKAKFSVTCCEYVAPSTDVVDLHLGCAVLANSQIGEGGDIPGLTDDTAEW